MPRQTKTCRVCGKVYEACNSVRTGGAFNWREVACSPECGTEYFRRVMASRSAAVSEEPKVSEVKEQPVTRTSKKKKAVAEEAQPVPEVVIEPAVEPELVETVEVAVEPEMSIEDEVIEKE